MELCFGTGCCTAELEGRGLSPPSMGLVFLRDAVLETVVEGTLDGGLVPGAESVLEGGGRANASAASASVRRVFGVVPRFGD